MTSSQETASRAPVVIAGYTVSIVCMVLCTGLRLFVKVRGPSEDRFHADDYLITLATVHLPPYRPILEVAYSIIMLAVGVRHGFGKHASILATSDLQAFLKGDYVASHLYNVGLASVKLGILTLYYRIFAIQWFRRIVIGCVTFVCLWIATIEIFMGLLCQPLEAIWDVSVKGHCFNSSALPCHFALPIRVIVRLRTTRSNKIALCIIFSIGFITCGISAARLAFVFAESSSDITWDGVDLGVLSGFESLEGILCANLPIIYRLFRQAAQKVTSRTGGSSSLPHLQYGRESKNFMSRSRPRRHRLDETLNEHWIQLQNGNSSNDSHLPGGPHDFAVQKVVDMETGMEVVRLSNFPNAITVKREFHQTVEGRR
ncbi:integral membrane protein PTH11-like protein [Aspergillus costaricaensis CBS 115574]|uniref:Integral membrane protein PTH11-like protein n=1 Tax=Aspergillus costaricaensis CBS 115574 TaxID=1448317 RepID=A0ACD1IGQ8_9EURO|nr:integral membrane protein PTH11-like protein [Aspergillus costaricaensis CBS 115574]RAK88962.1 integral membrane protein PTH11-like protein [Aspergillus costaricaensis CBS 115574]